MPIAEKWKPELRCEHCDRVLTAVIEHHCPGTGKVTHRRCECTHALKVHTKKSKNIGQDPGACTMCKCDWYRESDYSSPFIYQGTDGDPEDPKAPEEFAPR